MPSELQTYFPQLAHIGDVALRAKVEQCWQEAAKRGGWSVEDIDKIPFTLTLQGRANPSLARHTRYVTECSIALGKILSEAYRGVFSINFDHLIAGALLHDVGKLLEFGRGADGGYIVSDDGWHRRHPISGCALAAQLGLPEIVQHIIASHSWEGDKHHRCPEAYIVHHSDFVNYHPLKDAR